MHHDALLILIAGVLLATGVAASLGAARVRLPALVVFLGIGMAIGSDGLGWIEFDDYELARSIGTVALVLILFEGGVATGFREIRPVLRSSIVLAVGGPPTNVTSYALSGPGRIVIDVFGDSRKKAKVEFMKVIDPLVRRVRVAHHEGRMRLVLDLTTDVPPAYDLTNQGGTLTLSLGAARPEATSAAEH